MTPARWTLMTGSIALALTACSSGSISVSDSASNSSQGSSSASPATSESGSSTPSTAAGDTDAETLNTPKLEQMITDQIQAAVPTAKVDVECPATVAIDAGASFECTGTVNGQTVTVDVTQKTSDGRVHYESQQAFFDVSKVQLLLAKQLAAKVPGEWDLTCEAPGSQDGIYVAKPGAVFTCATSGTTAAGQPEQGTMRVTVTSSDGAVDWKIIPGAAS